MLSPEPILSEQLNDTLCSSSIEYAFQTWSDPELIDWNCICKAQLLYWGWQKEKGSAEIYDQYDYRRNICL